MVGIARRDDEGGWDVVVMVQLILEMKEQCSRNIKGLYAHL